MQRLDPHDDGPAKVVSVRLTAKIWKRLVKAVSDAERPEWLREAIADKLANGKAKR